MKSKNGKLLAIFLCILLLFTSPVCAKTAIKMEVNYGGYYTSSSWFQPHIIRQLEGGTYAWTVAGSVWYSKESGKWPGGYWDSGGYPWYMHDLNCKKYVDPYIVRTRLTLVAVRLDPAPSLHAQFLTLAGSKKRKPDIIQTVEIGTEET